MNIDIFDFELANDDVVSLDTNEYAPCTWDPSVSPLDN